LQCSGYFPADQSTTAIFGSITEEAVKKFQTAKGLPATGVVGPMTRNALNNL
jgi:peptidoglycan hydrolase-like protein with peptidoglycan-binding domain